jgi:hypothetical protein
MEKGSWDEMFLFYFLTLNSYLKVASLLGDTRSDVQCLHRWNKVLKVWKSLYCVLFFTFPPSLGYTKVRGKERKI